MYKEIYEWRIFDELRKGERIFALDTKENKVFDLLNCTIKSVCELLETAEKNKNRIIFYAWEEDEKNEQM